MPKLNVINLPDSTLTYSSKIYHNKTDFGLKTEIIITLNDGTIYESQHHDKISPASIAMTKVQRAKHNCSLNTIIDVMEHEYKTKNIFSEIIVKIGLITENKTIISLHEADIKDAVTSHFKNKLVSYKQSHIIKVNGCTQPLSCDIMTRETGYISDNTNIDIISNNVRLNVISNKIIKRDLFKENYTFESIGIGGLDKELADTVRRCLSTRAFSSDVISKLGVKHVKGMLLYGPPGTGKTLIARKIGSLISNIEPKIVNGPELLNRYVGQSQENIRVIFQDAMNDYEKNKENSELHIIIFDEFDAVFKIRGGDGTSADVNSSMVNQLLTLIDGVHALNNIFIIAMTNRKDLIDPALLRAGRIEVHIQIGLPDKQGREQIFRIHTDGMKNNHLSDNIDITKLADMTDNFSGSEIEATVKNASSRALYELLSSDIKDITDEDINVTMDHFISAVNEIVPSFGRVNKHMMSLIPEDYKFRSDIDKKIFTNITEIINSDSRFNTILIHGENLSGKTTLAAYIAQRNRVKYTRFLRAIDMISMGELQKASYITDNILDAFLSDKSLVVIDDVEIAMNYANISHSVSFSNRLYQTLITILKTPAFNKQNKLTIILTCSNENIIEMLSAYTTHQFKLNN